MRSQISVMGTVKSQKAGSSIAGFLNFVISLFKIRDSSSAGNGCGICCIRLDGDGLKIDSMVIAT